jgi:hypothetical protein
MRRTEIVFVIGAIIAAAGAFLAVRAGALATSWQRTESGNGWGGITDPALQHTYATMGLIGLCFGLALVALAAWRWLAGDRARLP